MPRFYGIKVKLSDKLDRINFINLKKFLDKYGHPDFKFDFTIEVDSINKHWDKIYDLASIFYAPNKIMLKLKSSFDEELSDKKINIILEFFNCHINIKPFNNNNKIKNTNLLNNIITLDSRKNDKYITTNVILNKDNIKDFSNTYLFFNHLEILENYDIDFSNINSSFYKEFIKQLELLKDHININMILSGLFAKDVMSKSPFKEIVLLESGKIVHNNFINLSDKNYFVDTNIGYEIINDKYFNIIEKFNNRINNKECKECKIYSSCKGGCYDLSKKVQKTYCDNILKIEEYYGEINEKNN